MRRSLPPATGSALLGTGGRGICSSRTPTPTGPSRVLPPPRRARASAQGSCPRAGMDASPTFCPST
eukprot:5684295-Alexandrium_andersonii.AAC.1